MRQLKGGTSYASTIDPHLFVGLGSDRSAKSVEIAWPSGEKQSLTQLEGDTSWIVREGEAAVPEH